MADLSTFHVVEQLGPVASPLLLSSLLTGMIVLERIVVLGFFSVTRDLHEKTREVFGQHDQIDPELVASLASAWLDQLQRKLFRGLRLLHMVAAIAPLLGLLGTVLGLMQVFGSLSALDAPLQPKDLAEGLGLAMNTTAAGLCIAISALAANFLLGCWAAQLLRAQQNALNTQHFSSQGLQVEFSS